MSDDDALTTEEVAEMLRAFSLDGQEPLVIAGNDLSGDIIAHALAPPGCRSRVPTWAATPRSSTCTQSKRTRRSSRRDAPTWRSASSVWRRSRPRGSALLWWCRLLFGDTCIIACLVTDGRGIGRAPHPSSRFVSFRPKGKIGDALLIDRRFLWQILKIKYFPISERMTILHNETRRRSRERTKPSSA